MEDVIYERYRELACAVIAQGIDDWLQRKDATDYDLYHWIQHCDWFDYLDLDREYFYVKVLRLKEKGIDGIKWSRNGKNKEQKVRKQ